MNNLVPTGRTSAKERVDTLRNVLDHTNCTQCGGGTWAHAYGPPNHTVRICADCLTIIVPYGLNLFDNGRQMILEAQHVVRTLRAERALPAPVRQLCAPSA